MDSVRVATKTPMASLGTTDGNLFKTSPSQALTVPLVQNLFGNTNGDLRTGSPTSSAGSTSSSTDKTDNNDAFGIKKPDVPDMRSEDERLKTFERWPHLYLSPALLAKNGFYYLGREDEVRCAFCKVEIMRWMEGDDPAKDHQRWAPQCPFVRRQLEGVALTDASVSGRDECGPHVPKAARMPGPVHTRYATLAARMRSFEDWPRSLRQKPEELAEAGFFYTGHGDKTKCFYCDGGLKDWETDDIPWEQHARWFDRCAYVHLVKGRDYVQKVMSEACAIPAPKEETPKPEIETNVDKKDLEQSPEDDAKMCKICYAEERNVCFVPCGHVVACAKCALSTDKCPMCRRTFTNAVRLYFS